MDGEDGSIQHFGRIFPNYKEATIYMTCKKNSKGTEYLQASWFALNLMNMEKYIMDSNYSGELKFFDFI